MLYFWFVPYFSMGLGEVLVEKPAYEPLWAVAKAFGGRIIRLDRVYEKGYAFNLDELEKHLSENVKFILLTNLHNPSGVSLSPSTLKDMAGIAKKKGVFLVVDEVYLGFSGKTSIQPLSQGACSKVLSTFV